MEAAAAVLLYALACELYIFLFSMVSSSISVSLLLALQGHREAAADLQALYPKAGMVSRRLEKLASSGLLVKIDGCYEIDDKGRRLIAVFRQMRKFFGHE